MRSRRMQYRQRRQGDSRPPPLPMSITQSSCFWLLGRRVSRGSQLPPQIVEAIAGLPILDPSTSAETDAVLTQAITNSRYVPSMPRSSRAVSIASYLKVSNALEKSIVMKARREVLLQLKDCVNSCESDRICNSSSFNECHLVWSN